MIRLHLRDPEPPPAGAVAPGAGRARAFASRCEIHVVHTDAFRISAWALRRWRARSGHWPGPVGLSRVSGAHDRSWGRSARASGTCPDPPTARGSRACKCGCWPATNGAEGNRDCACALLLQFSGQSPPGSAPSGPVPARPVPGAAIQLQPSAGEGFSFREPPVVREKRGQAEEGLRIATLAEVDGFLEGLLSLGRLSQAHVG